MSVDRLACDRAVAEFRRQVALRVVLAIQDLRVRPVTVEYDLHREIAAVLTNRGIAFQREVPIAPRCRIDFLATGGVGIEVKKGKSRGPETWAQVRRYCQSEKLAALVLVVERNVHRPGDTCEGKPVHYVALNRLWGIAL